MAGIWRGKGTFGLGADRGRVNAMRRARRSPSGLCPRCNGAVKLSEIKELHGVRACYSCRKRMAAEEKERGSGLAVGGPNPKEGEGAGEV